MKTLSTDSVVTAFIDIDEAVDHLRLAVEEGDLDSAKAALGEVDEARTRHAPPVSVAFASRLLDVTQPTVRSWAKRGILQLVRKSPQALSLESVRSVQRVLTETRQSADDKGRYIAVLEARADRRLLERDDVAAAVAEALRGETVPMPALD